MPSEENKSKEKKAAESDAESFRKEQGPFVVAAETTRMAMVFTDAKEANHPIIFVNDSFLSPSRIRSGGSASQTSACRWTPPLLELAQMEGSRTGAQVPKGI